MAVFRDLEGNFYDIPADDLKRYRVEGELPEKTQVTGQVVEPARSLPSGGPTYNWSPFFGPQSHNYPAPALGMAQAVHQPAHNYPAPVAAYNYQQPAYNYQQQAYNYQQPAYNYQSPSYNYHGPAYNYQQGTGGQGIAYNYQQPSRPGPSSAYNYEPTGGPGGGQRG